MTVGFRSCEAITLSTGGTMDSMKRRAVHNVIGGGATDTSLKRPRPESPADLGSPPKDHDDEEEDAPLSTYY